MSKHFELGFPVPKCESGWCRFENYEISSIGTIAKGGTNRYFHSSEHQRVPLQCQTGSLPEFYGDLVYRIRQTVGQSSFSEQFRKLINRYKRIGYNPFFMQQTACPVINPTSVDSYASLFNCMTAGRASDSMTAST